ncbi:unnamed protein product [Sphagnum jensenii]
MDSTDDDEEEDEDVLPFSLNRSFKPSFPDEEGITLEDVEAIEGTIPWAEKENPCERPLPKRTAGRDGGKGRRSKAPGEETGGRSRDDLGPQGDVKVTDGAKLRSILCDVTKGCSDRFLDRGPLRDGVRSIYEREF